MASPLAKSLAPKGKPHLEHVDSHVIMKKKGLPKHDDADEAKAAGAGEGSGAGAGDGAGARRGRRSSLEGIKDSVKGFFGRRKSGAEDTGSDAELAAAEAAASAAASREFKHQDSNKLLRERKKKHGKSGLGTEAARDSEDSEMGAESPMSGIGPAAAAAAAEGKDEAR
mmetsp:Transcript_72881/g.202016  ORF Transcript_72881/g.202016 Transcript_72881/m.202016 type:complete len:169 (+) Transcript_72881:163-669(+)